MGLGRPGTEGSTRARWHEGTDAGTAPLQRCWVHRFGAVGWVGRQGSPGDLSPNRRPAALFLFFFRNAVHPCGFGRHGVA